MATVKESISLSAPAADVWSFIGEFAHLDRWHPVVAECRVSTDQPITRELTMRDGRKITERLDAEDQAARRYTYTILDAGPLPVTGYQSTLMVTEAGANAQVSWSSEFEPHGASEVVARAAITGVYTSGFAALAEKFGTA